MTLIAGYISALVVMLGLDGIWLSRSYALIYRPVLGPLQGPKTVWAAAAVFYLLYPLGALFFAVYPALRSGSWMTALLNGAMLGFFAYATYDLTNFATLRGWTLSITLADIAWGMVITSSAATASYFVASYVAAKIH